MFQPSCLVTILPLVLLACGLYLWLKARRYKDFAGSLGTPIIGNLYQCLTNYWHPRHSCYIEYMHKNVEKYGPLCSFWLCHKVNLAVCDPSTIEKLAFNSSLGDKPAISYNSIGWFMRNTFSFLQNDKEWRLRRKELNNMLKKSNMESFHLTFLNAGNKSVDILAQNSSEFDCMPDMMLLTLEVVVKTHFGLELNLIGDRALFDEMHTSSELMAASLTNPLLGLIVIVIAECIYMPKHEEKFELTIYEKMIDKLKKLKLEEDMKNVPYALTVALRNISRNSTKRELLREFVEIVYVGSHTVGTTLASALVFLATNPHVQQKVWQEQQDIFGDSDRETTVDDLGRMQYLERFFKELLRFMGPPLSIKEALADIEIGGKVIPKGTILTIYSRWMRFDPKYWNDPLVFDPDRFLHENIAKVPKHVSATFGFGIRTCPGPNYATYLFKMIISTVVRKLEIQSTMNFDQIKYSGSLMMEIVGGYKVSAKKRILEENGNVK